MAALEDQMSLSTLKNNVLKMKNVAKKSTTSTPPGSKPSSCGPSRESSPEKKVIIMNGQNKNHNDLSSLTTSVDMTPNRNGSPDGKSLKRDLEESGGGDNPAKQARMQIEDIEKRQEVMLQTAVGPRPLTVTSGANQDTQEDVSKLDGQCDEIDKTISNGVELEVDSAQCEASVVLDSCATDSIHSTSDKSADNPVLMDKDTKSSNHNQTTTNQDKAADNPVLMDKDTKSSNYNQTATNQDTAKASPPKLSKPSFTLGNKAKDTFKEILKAAVSRVSSDAAEKYLSTPEKVSINIDSNSSLNSNSSVLDTDSPSKCGSSTVSTPKSGVLDKGNLFENMSLNFSSRSGTDKSLKCPSSREDSKEIEKKPNSGDTNDKNVTPEKASSLIKPNSPGATSETVDNVEAGHPSNETPALGISDAEVMETESAAVCTKALNNLETKASDIDTLTSKTLDAVVGKQTTCTAADESSSQANAEILETDTQKESQPESDDKLAGTETAVPDSASMTENQATSTEKECSKDLLNSGKAPQVTPEVDELKCVVNDVEKSSADAELDEELMLLGSGDLDVDLDTVDESILDDDEPVKFTLCNSSSIDAKLAPFAKDGEQDNTKEIEALPPESVKLDNGEISTVEAPSGVSELDKSEENTIVMQVDNASDKDFEQNGENSELQSVLSDGVTLSGDAANDSDKIMEDDAKEVDSTVQNDCEEESNKRKLSLSSVEDKPISKKVKVDEDVTDSSIGDSTVIVDSNCSLGNGVQIDSDPSESSVIKLSREDLPSNGTDIEACHDKELVKDEVHGDASSTEQKDDDDSKSQVKDMEVELDEKSNDSKSGDGNNVTNSELKDKVNSDDIKSEVGDKIGAKSEEGGEKAVDVCDDDADSMGNDDLVIMEDSSIPSTSTDKPEEKLESGPDGMLKISRRALERLICQKMETVLASDEHIKLVSDLQNRIAKLTFQMNKWKTAAKAYQSDIMEATRPGRPERRRAARGTVRHVAIQVDEARIQAGKLASPAKSGVHKTPPRPQAPPVVPSPQLAPKPTATVTNQAGQQTLILPVASASANGTISLIAPPSNLPPASANIASGQYRFNTLPQGKGTVREMLDTRRPSDSSDKSNPVVVQTGQPAAKPATPVAAGTKPVTARVSEKVIDLTEDDESPAKTVATGTVTPGQVVVRQGVPTSATANNPNLRTGTYLVPVSNGQPILLQPIVGQGLRSPVIYTSAPGQQVGPAGQQLVTIAPGQNAIRPVVMQTPATQTTVATKAMIATRAQTTVKASPATQNMVPSRTAPIRANKHPAPLPPQPISHKVSPDLKSQPPKPSLKISRVPQGIVLSWNMTLTDSNADVTNYQLFAYQEGSSPPYSTLWKRVGDVKALPLPMACTLTQFHEGNKYHFAVRAVDEHTRIGPFSDPSSIHLEATPKS